MRLTKLRRVAGCITGIAQMRLKNISLLGCAAANAFGIGKTLEGNMQGVARKFFILAVVYAICGMLLGLEMGISGDHSQMPVHAHMMVLGWLMSAVFAFFYHLFPAARETRLAQAHFWLTAVSGVILVVSLFFLLAGNEALEPVTAVASMGFLAGMLLFAWISVRVVRRA